MKSTTGMGRSTTRRVLTGQLLLNPAEKVDERKLRPKAYSADSRSLLELVWALMGYPAGITWSCCGASSCRRLLRPGTRTNRSRRRRRSRNCRCFIFRDVGTP